MVSYCKGFCAVCLQPNIWDFQSIWKMVSFLFELFVWSVGLILYTSSWMVKERWQGGIVKTFPSDFSMSFSACLELVLVRLNWCCCGHCITLGSWTMDNHCYCSLYILKCLCRNVSGKRGVRTGGGRKELEWICNPLVSFKWTLWHILFDEIWLVVGFATHRLAQI